MSTSNIFGHWIPRDEEALHERSEKCKCKPEFNSSTGVYFHYYLENKYLSILKRNIGDVSDTINNLYLKINKENSVKERIKECFTLSEGLISSIRDQASPSEVNEIFDLFEKESNKNELYEFSEVFYKMKRKTH